MKIALCYSGLIRFYEESYQSQLDNLIIPNDCDIFIYTTNLVDHSKNIKNVSKFNHQIINISELKSKLLKFYGKRVKKIKIDKDKRKDKLLFGQAQQILVHKCNELRKEYEKEMNIEYDYIIRIRFDLKIKIPINIEQIIEEIGNDGNDGNKILNTSLNKCIYIYQWIRNNQTTIPPKKIKPNASKYFDGFAIGKSAVMEIYCDLNLLFKYGIVRKKLINKETIRIPKGAVENYLPLILHKTKIKPIIIGNYGKDVRIIRRK